VDTAVEDRPRLGLWHIDVLKGAGPHGHTLYQVTRNDAPIWEPFLYRRDAAREMMRAVRQSIIRDALQSSDS
jgi:hypothetical protein